MPSRMERYHDSDNVSSSRIQKNKSLYEQIYEEKEYTNVEGIAKTPVAGSVDIAKIREMINNRETKKVREKKEYPELQMVEDEYDDPKNYDIKDVLSKAKDERKIENNNYHSLKNVELDILKKLNIKKNEEEAQDQEEIKELFNTITNTSMLNKLGDKELSLDLLDELKSNDNTVIESSETIRNILDQTKEEPEAEQEMDKSFYTKSMNLEEDLEPLMNDDDNIRENKKLFKVFIIIGISAVIIALVIIILLLLKK